MEHWSDRTISFDQIDFAALPLRIDTARYTCLDFQRREREEVWMKVWQVAGRADELPEGGDWKEYKIFDQSFLIVRDKDGKLRGFINACRHRGNILCQGKGHDARFTCPYHLWSFGLDGKLLAVSRPDLVGPLDKAEHALFPVSVDVFAGFIFINPDAHAKPLLECLGDDVVAGLAPYRLDEMTPVGLDVREELDCNWKVVIDAFSEGYHISGVHPELLRVIEIEAGKSRYGFYGDHGMACAPFDVKKREGFGPEDHIKGIRELPGTFPTVAMVLPRFEELIGERRDGDGKLHLADGITPRTILQQATRDTLTAKGLDVAALSDDQMSDNQGWFLFPNFFMTIRAGEATVITSYPDPAGDPNKCIWHVTAYMWLPEDARAPFRAEPVTVTERGSFPYFLALQQDYDHMQRQQLGLRQRGLSHMSLARDEVNVARFHQVLDRHLAGASGK